MEVESAAAVAAVDLPVLWRERSAAIGDARVLYPAEDLVEFRLAHLEGVVVDLEIPVGVKIESERLVHLHRREVGLRACISQAEDSGEEPGALLLVAGGHDGVVEHDGHGASCV